ncbi:MAG: hypothetical protein AAGA42_06225 [Actinomycetota bacterium]
MPRQELSVAGYDIIISGTSEWLIDAVCEFFGGPNAPNMTDGRDRLEVHVEANEAPVDHTVGRAPDHREGPVRCWYDDPLLHLAHDLGASATATESGISIGVDVTNPLQPQMRHLLFSALSWWLDRKRTLLLHAALISRRELGLLILGPSGAGKSTLAYAAHRAGWAVHSDDLVVIRATSSPTGYGVPKPLSIDRALLPAAVHRSGAEQLDQRSRVRISSEMLSRQSTPIGALVVLGHSDADGSIVTRPDSLAAIAEGFLEAHRPESMKRQLPTIAKLASLPAYELLHDRKPSARVDSAAALLESITATVSESQ